MTRVAHAPTQPSSTVPPANEPQPFLKETIADSQDAYHQGQLHQRTLDVLTETFDANFKPPKQQRNKLNKLRQLQFLPPFPRSYHLQSWQPTTLLPTTLLLTTLLRLLLP